MKKLTATWHSLAELSTQVFAERVHEGLRTILARQLSVREEERTMMAREIHDDLGQILAALKTDLILLNNKLNDRNESASTIQFSSEIQSMSNLVDSAIAAMRRVITELRSEVLEHHGLKAAIEWQAQEFQSRTKIPVEIRSHLKTIEMSDRNCATVVFRMFQEALSNIGRHANASHVEATIQENNEFFIMQVKDDGIGISESDLAKVTSFGLIGLKERAFLLQGDVDIQGVPNQGTTVTVRLPVSICRGSNGSSLANN
jgi:signal transduction histidine kinase